VRQAGRSARSTNPQPASEKRANPPRKTGQTLRAIPTNCAHFLKES
jgi:hypothetical protein